MLVQTNDHEVIGNMPGETVNMTVEQQSLQHIMDILSDLYSNRPSAIVREYTTNALDSHIISGQTKPVEIRTPNRLNPNLVIRDFGAGMSKQHLIDTYSKYGASTKRSNNLEAGQLGLGSKSAFAYTDQFTVRSIHNGHCCELIMSRNEHGAAEMTIAVDYATDDPNGVTITIPIKSYDVDEVCQAVDNFARYATPGTISVNGVANTRPAEWVKVTDNVYKTQANASHMVVMGNVAYPMKIDEHDYPYRHNFRLIFFVGMGEVDFTPSREELKYTPRTKKTIQDAMQYLEDFVTAEVEKGLEGDDSRRNRALVYKKATEWETYFPMSRITSSIDLGDLADGTERLAYEFPLDFDSQYDKLFPIVKARGDGKDRLPHYQILNSLDRESCYVTDFKGTRLTRNQARKIATINPDFEGSHVTLFDGPKSAVEDLFPNANFVSWDDAKNVKLPKKPRKSNRTKNQVGDEYLGVMVHNQLMRTGEKLMTTNGPAFYISKAEWNNRRPTLPRSDFKLFFVPPSKQKTFLEKNPHVKSLEEYSQNRASQISNMVKKNPRIKDSIRYATQPSVTRWINLAEITNQEFANVVKKSRTGYKWARLAGTFSYYGSEYVAYCEENLPLVDFNGYGLTTKKIEHMIQYINMIGEGNGRD